MRLHHPWRKTDIPIQVHKTFVYLDDSLTVDSLSAIEAGKIDKVVEKINHAESGTRTSTKNMTFTPNNKFKMSITGGKDRQTDLSLQEEVVRRRTSVSIFEQWLQIIKKKQAILEIKEWNEQKIGDLYPGELIQFTGTINISPVEAGLRTFVEIANRAISGDPLFEKVLDPFNDDNQSQKSLSTTNALHIREARKRQASNTVAKQKDKIAQIENIKNSILSLLGDEEAMHGLVSFQTQKESKIDETTKIGIRIDGEWVKETIGLWRGQYTIVAQIDEILSSEDSWPTVRFFKDMPITPAERTIIHDTFNELQSIVSDAFQIPEHEDMSCISGPIVVIHPIAIYR